MQFKNIAGHTVDVAALGVFAADEIKDTLAMELLDDAILSEWGIYSAVKGDCIVVYKNGAELTKQESLDYFISPNL